MQAEAIPDLPFTHLSLLMGPHGLFEHARHRTPRLAHGYTTDDNARALLVTAGEPEAEEIYGRCRDFVVSALGPDGWRNRMNAAGQWTERLGSEDAHGRAIWGLATASKWQLEDIVLAALERGSHRRLHALRAITYEALGAVAALELPEIGSTGIRIAERYRACRPRPKSRDWPWPEDRLTYDNARIPQAMMAIGAALDDRSLLADGIDMLEWLVEVETSDDRFSFTPVGGRGPGDPNPAFDQQPIEAWAMADACAVATEVTGDEWWRDRAVAAVEWFWGRNPSGAVLVDPETGAGFDGLHQDGVNLNAGAESTLAVLGAHRTLRLVRTRMATRASGPAP